MDKASESGGISRRSLLIGGGVGLGLLVAWSVWPRRYGASLRAAEGETPFNAFLKIARDGRVIVAIPQAELGQGSYTSLPQILADELGADWRTISVEPAPISSVYANFLLAEQAARSSAFPGLFGLDRWAARRYASTQSAMITAGSTSVRGFEARLREAGAGARALLSLAAADRWETDWQLLDTREGFVWRESDRLPFAELAEAAAGYELPEQVPVRGGPDNRLVGQPLPRLDVPAKIDGSAMFAGDVRLPGMVHAALRSGPKGSRLAGLDKAAADRVHGALRIVEGPDWVAVAGSTWWAAAKALDELRPRFERPVGLPDDQAMLELLRAAVEGEGDGDRLHERGEVAGPHEGASRVTALYSVGAAPAAALEPLVATARILGDQLEIWAPTQAPGFARAAAARAIGFPEGRVALYPTLAGGGYGRKLEVDAIEQAAVLALRLDRPVQLTWPRIQEIQNDSLRPPAAARMTAWVGQAGIAAWQARIAAPDVAAQVADRIGAAQSFFRPDGGPAGGAVPPYDIAHLAVDHVGVDLPLHGGVWRSGAQSYTAFFTESFVDELARLAGVEPLSFRMRMLGGNSRLARALSTAATIGGWDGGAPGSGMGIAVHSGFGSHIATLVEVEVARDQSLRVLRAVCAVDCGRVVNPEIVRQQIEGGLVHGLAAALGEPLEIRDRIPTARSYGAFRLPVLRNSPEVTVELLESEEEPGGVTELAVPTAAPAVANALFSLVGQRQRQLPLRVGGRR